MVHILKAGVHYEAAPVEIREKIVFPPHIVGKAMLQLNQLDHVDETIILSTCNRTEIYISTENKEAGIAAIKRFVSDWFGLSEMEFLPYLEWSADEETVLHLFRMTAGLDSMVLGETQILGQVRDAFMEAQALKTTKKLFNELFKRVITFAKRAHKETAIGEQAVSVSYVAVELAKKIFGDIADKHVLIIGAGETGELTLKNLHGAGVTSITVANRTYERAADLAGKFQAGAIAFEDIGAVMQDVDIVISATACPVPVLTKEKLQPLQKQRKGHPLFLIDIAVPRDIDPQIAELDSVFLYDMDDLKEVVEKNMAARAETAEIIEKQLKPELVSFNNWVTMLDAVPVIRALREKSLSIQESTLESIHRKMPDLTEREAKVLQKHTKSIIHQLLEEPIKQAKTMAESEEELKQFERIFGLSHGSQ